MNRNQVIEKLRRLDEALYFSGAFRDGARPAIVIIGGAALMLQNLSLHPVTKDIDVFRSENLIAELLFEDSDINTQCQAFVMNIPFNFEDRLSEIPALNFRILRVLAPSPEDLAVMKLYRWEDPDKSDLLSETFLASLDWGLLEHLITDPDEAPASRISRPSADREYQQMLRNFDEYRKLARHGK